MKPRGPSILRRVSGYLQQNFEQVFVLLVLFITVVINFYIPQKIAFLNFYYLPVVLAGYYLGQRRAVLVAVLSSTSAFTSFTHPSLFPRVRLP